MVRAPSIDPRSGLKKGEWSEEEDNKLRAYVQRYGHSNWRQLPKSAGKKINQGLKITSFSSFFLSPPVLCFDSEVEKKKKEWPKEM